ncbi:general transcription factor II-I repeat domain-containing protein 2A-like [Astyanax mexicanus]|uniref:general transcription factor II-I repeat domain-containing protein 2A-like n=1 Tax=Astyanax mexicanus TaxID=7994 RepID=UPI0020CB47F9|nr:general transcription factor II-I repeat domain-containing protein 2A-like [Astyanax mexicanus]
MLEACDVICPEAKDAFKNISLSRTTIQRRIVDLSSNSYCQLQSRINDVTYFSAALDESTDNTDTAQLSIFIRGVTGTCQVYQELAALVPLYGRTTGFEIFNAFKTAVENLNLPWSKLSAVTTDGAPSMVGETNGFIGHLKRHLGPDQAAELKHYHCIIHQEALCGKHLQFKQIMDFVVSAVNFIRARSLNHREFQSFLEDISAAYGDVIYHTEVRWLSRGNVLKIFFALRNEIKLFLEQKGKDTLVMENTDWIADLAFLTDLTGLLNELNLKLQGKDRLICHLFEAVCAFEMKLNLFATQLKKGNLTHFPTCQEAFAHKNYNWSRHSCVLEDLKLAFSARFGQFRNEQATLQLLADPFSVDTETVPGELQLEIIELKCSTAMRTKHREMPLLEFYQSLDREQFPNLFANAQKWISMFGSTYICEQMFSLMKLNKSPLRTRLTDENLQAVLRLATTSLEPDINQLVSERRCNISH